MFQVGNKQKIPAWAGYNAQIKQQNSIKTVVCYLPFINAPSSDFSTIYTAFCNLVKIGDKNDQLHLLANADMAQQILWGDLDTLDNKITLRIGKMHLIMSYISCI